MTKSGIGSEREGLGASPISKWVVAEDDGKYNSNGAHDRYTVVSDQVREGFSGILFLEVVRSFGPVARVTIKGVDTPRTNDAEYIATPRLVCIIVSKVVS